MKNRNLLLAVCFGLVCFFPTLGMSEGFTGPGNQSNKRKQGGLVTVAEAKKLADDTRVSLQGTIVRSLGDEDYAFQDDTGEITVDIDRKVWRGLSVGENDRVEIYGEVDVERRRTEIDVKTIQKI